MGLSSRRTRTYLLAAGAMLVVMAAIFAVVRGRKRAWQLTAIGARADWCPAGFEPIDGDGCLASGGSSRELVVYLHGMYAPGGGEHDENERRARVARIAKAHGFSVLALRGRQGECSAEDKRTHFCWPSNERNAGDGPAFAARMASAIAAVDAKLGSQKRRCLLGFSNGGYFAALVATRALVPFDAVAIAGAGPVEPVRADGPKPPILLLAADEDASVESMMRLDTELGRAGWPHTIASRNGGHALTDADVTLAVTFFERTRRESLPLNPPLSTRAPHPKLARDGAADAGTSAPTEPASPARAATPAPNDAGE